MFAVRGFMSSGIACLIACGGGSDAAGGTQGEASRSAAGSEQCDILTAADVQAATGTAGQRIERNPAIGAGGTCVNFGSADGQAYLGVNRLGSGFEMKDHQLRDLAAKALTSAR